MFSPTSVSYTHLDVYKRQRLSHHGGRKQNKQGSKWKWSNIFTSPPFLSCPSWIHTRRPSCLQIVYSNLEYYSIIWMLCVVFMIQFNVREWICGDHNGSCIMITPSHKSHLIQGFLVKHRSLHALLAHYSPDMFSCDFCLFTNLKGCYLIARRTLW